MQLPDAEKRLLICEQRFKKSYGENLNRLVALKGFSGLLKTIKFILIILFYLIFITRINQQK